ncbi:MAG: glycosyltransferase family 4 protein [Anaerolineales bacterium]|nr:glycosyltransferase family 4 protein [Anaerolineales bacterium]MCX7753854.1 glycosyltransferase family 4 protein [Anaerolineales bacterium]MDW8279178.1 glycosyltransferase family 4 protein [Anaerolineales bacterium]
MKILIFGGHYEPDLGPSAPIFTMLCENLVRLGHQVTMIAGVPHFPSGRVPAKWRGKLLWHSVENGVEVIRVGLPSVDRMKLPWRLLQYLTYQIGTTLAGLRREYDVVLSGSSSLTSWLPFAVLAVWRRKPSIYAVYDVYPGVGIKLGIFRHKPVIWLITQMETFCLHRSTLVRIISESFRSELLEMGVPDEKMVMIYDWVDTELVRPLPQDNPFAQENDLVGKFVVLYAGNLGLSQGLEHVLAAAEMLADHQDLLFVFVGDGANRERLVSSAHQRQLKNVRFLPFQPRDRLPEVAASASVSLVTLQRGIANHSIPSKTFTILASGRPIIASIDEDSDAWRLIQKAQAGLCVPPEDPAALAAAILQLREAEEFRKTLGENARKWAEDNHSPLSGAMKIEKMLFEAIKISSRP